MKLEDDKSVEAMLEYFYGTQEIVRTFSSAQPQLLSLRALSDLVGGYDHFIKSTETFKIYMYLSSIQLLELYIRTVGEAIFLCRTADIQKCQ